MRSYTGATEDAASGRAARPGGKRRFAKPSYPRRLADMPGWVASKTIR